jgi:AraC-like DNA-binding protein
MASFPWPEVCAADLSLAVSSRYLWHNRDRAGSEQCVIQWTLAGEGEIIVDDQSYFAPRHSAMLFDHTDGSTYQFSRRSRETYRFRYIAFEPGSLRPIFNALRGQFGPVLELSPKGRAATSFVDLFDSFNGDCQDTTLSRADKIWGLLLALHEEQLESRSSRDPIARGRQRLTDDVRGMLSVQEIAEQVGVSREHFVRQFTLRFGESPGKFRRRQRLTRARRMLQSGVLTIESVAAACGFSGADAFRRSFTDYFGVGPNAMRPSGRPKT